MAETNATTERPSPAQHFTVLRTVWMALMASVVVYVVVGVLVLTVTPLGAEPIMARGEAATVLKVVAAIGVVAALASIGWARRALTPNALAAAGGDIVLRFKTVHLTCWALAEVAAVVGLAGSLLTGDAQPVVVGATVALVVMGVLERPVASVLEEAERAARRRAPR